MTKNNQIAKELQHLISKVKELNIECVIVDSSCHAGNEIASYTRREDIPGHFKS